MLESTYSSAASRMFMTLTLPSDSDSSESLSSLILLEIAAVSCTFLGDLEVIALTSKSLPARYFSY